MIGLIYSRVNIKLRQKTIIPCVTNTNKQPQVNKNFISFGIHQQLAKLDMTSFANIIPHLVFSPAVHDLSIALDQELTFAPQIHSPGCACYYQLHRDTYYCMLAYSYSRAFFHCHKTGLLLFSLCWSYGCLA